MNNLRPETRATLRALWLICLAVLAIPVAGVAGCALVVLSVADAALVACGNLKDAALSGDAWWRRYDWKGRRV